MNLSLRAAFWLVALIGASANCLAHEPLSADFFCEDPADLNSIRGKPIEDLRLWKSNVRDLSPLKGMPLRKLVIFGCPVKDLSPLRGMPLESVWIGATEARDFSPLKGLPLKRLNLFVSEVTDISFLQGMQLESLDLSVCGSGKVTDLSPIKGMQLRFLDFEANTVTNGMDIVRQMKSLEKINDQTPKEFWREYESEAPARDRLRKAGVNYRSLFITEDGTWRLRCYGDDLKDLSLLKGLPVCSLELEECEIKDLSPLRDMKITDLNLKSPTLNDLSTLKGAPLTTFVLDCPKVGDISPLKGMPLGAFYLRCAQVTNVSALHGMPLKTLNILGANVRDITPIEGAPLEFLCLDARHIPEGMEVLRSMKTLKQINYHDAKAFWEKYDAGKLDQIQVCLLYTSPSPRD